MGFVVNLKGTTEAIFERTEGLKRYFNDINKYPVLSKEEELALFKVYQNGTAEEKQKAKERIVNANQRFVVAVAKKYGTNDNVLELISEGNIGLLEAMDCFDLTKDVKFVSWAVYFIRRQINRYLVDYGTMVKKNNNAKTYHLLSKATNDFIQKEHREPTSEEILELLNEKYDANIKDVKDVTPTRMSSIDEGYNTEDDSTNLGDIALYNTYSASANGYEKDVAQDYARSMISSLLGTLTPRERTVMEMAYGIGHYREYTNEEIAEQVDLTKERVRQLKETLLTKMQEEYFKRVDKAK